MPGIIPPYKIKSLLYFSPYIALPSWKTSVEHLFLEKIKKKIHKSFSSLKAQNKTYFGQTEFIT